MGFGETILRILGALLALALVLFLAWFTLQWMGRRMTGTTGRSGHLLKVLDRVPLGKGSSLLLVRVQDKVYFIASSEHTIEKIGEIEDPDETLKLPDPAETISFTDALKDAAKKLKGPKDQGKPGGSL